MQERHIAYIDLSRADTTIRQIPPEVWKLYLGGRGINMYLLYNHITEGTDAMGPDNVLVFGTGLLTGTAAPSAARFNVSAKSPLTGFLGDSNCGGFWGPELRFAGFDHLVIKGRSDHPVYMWIKDEQIEFRDASHLWGLDTIETQEAIKNELQDPQIQIVCIGQAGENLVRFACVRHSYKEAAGRTGMGAVMGSKNLKAIAVRGSMGIEVNDPERLLNLRRSIDEEICRSKSCQAISRYGTSFLVDAHQRLGCLTVNNFQRSATEGDEWKSIGMVSIDEYCSKKLACFGCSLHCRHGYRVPFGEHRGEWAEGPEYYALMALGARTGTFDLKTVLVAQDLCNRYGMDVGSAGNVIAWAMELYQRDILSQSVTDGLCLEWGNGEALLELLKRIALKQGFGSVLADDGLRAAKVISSNSIDYFQHVKGMSTCTDERTLKGAALNAATASRGADHLRSRPIPEGLSLPEEVLEQMYGGVVASDPTSYEGKARAVVATEKMLFLPDALGLCKFLARTFLSPTGLIGYQEFSDMLYAVTGLKLSPGEMEHCAERVINIERMFNIREGLGREHDTLPKRYFDETSKGGALDGQKIDRRRFEQMLDEYYEFHGWGIDGNPTEETLDRLGLDSEQIPML